MTSLVTDSFETDFLFFLSLWLTCRHGNPAVVSFLHDSSSISCHSLDDDNDYCEPLALYHGMFVVISL